MEELKSLDWVQAFFNVLMIYVPLIIVFLFALIGVIKYLTRPGYKEIDEKASKEECRLTDYQQQAIGRFNRKGRISVIAEHDLCKAKLIKN